MGRDAVSMVSLCTVWRVMINCDELGGSIVTKARTRAECCVVEMSCTTSDTSASWLRITTFLYLTISIKKYKHIYTYRRADLQVVSSLVRFSVP